MKNVKEYNPLLKPGLHKLTWSDFVSLTIESDFFKQSQSRKIICVGFKNVMKHLHCIDIDLELWADGSFLTEKIDPNDIDVVLKVDGEELNQLPQEKQTGIKNYLNRMNKKNNFTDSYILATFNEGNEMYWHSEYMKAYWLRQFGFSRTDKMKGIAVLNPEEVK